MPRTTSRSSVTPISFSINHIDGRFCEMGGGFWAFGFSFNTSKSIGFAGPTFNKFVGSTYQIRFSITLVIFLLFHNSICPNLYCRLIIFRHYHILRNLLRSTHQWNKIASVRLYILIPKMGNIHHNSTLPRIHMSNRQNIFRSVVPKHHSHWDILNI